jgi:hypothetical protein
MFPGRRRNPNRVSDQMEKSYRSEQPWETDKATLIHVIPQLSGCDERLQEAYWGRKSAYESTI